MNQAVFRPIAHFPVQLHTVVSAILFKRGTWRKASV